MRSFRGGLLAWFFLVSVCALRAEATNDAPDFQEVYSLLRTHLGGVSEADLNRAAVAGLLAKLAPKATLIPAGETPAPVATPKLSRIAVFEQDLGYLRVATVAEGLAGEISAICRQLGATNHLSGLVLDLRFAGGTDYSAAVEVADLFAARTQPLLDWGEGVATSHEKTNAVRLRLALLVNHQTTGAAEALAASLREAEAGLLLGSRTAGQAWSGRRFPLAGGAQLRIATTPVKLGDGSKFPDRGLAPDIEVTVAPEQEKTFFTDAFAHSSEPPASPTNAFPARLRMNEAELVREHKAGLEPSDDDETPANARPAASDQPLVRDPALARALDLLKGLAVVRPASP